MGTKHERLDIDERYALYRLHEAGKGVREIGRPMGRSVSTISRELHRDTLPRGGTFTGCFRAVVIGAKAKPTAASRRGAAGGGWRSSAS